jgi:hypothetical protein
MLSLDGAAQQLHREPFAAVSASEVTRRYADVVPEGVAFRP